MRNVSLLEASKRGLVEVVRRRLGEGADPTPLRLFHLPAPSSSSFLLPLLRLLSCFLVACLLSVPCIWMHVLRCVMCCLGTPCPPSPPPLFFIRSWNKAKGLGLGDSKWTRKEERERERRKIRKGKDWLEERRPPARSAPHHAAAGEGHRKWMDG